MATQLSHICEPLERKAGFKQAQSGAIVHRPMRKLQKLLAQLSIGKWALGAATRKLHRLFRARAIDELNLDSRLSRRKTCVGFHLHALAQRGELWVVNIGSVERSDPRRTPRQRQRRCVINAESAANRGV